MKSLFRPFPLPLNGKQWFYLGFLQGVGAGVIDGGLNFLVAWAMYHSQHEVKMWVFKKNTIAGDLGVTPLIQCAASMVITSTLVHTDLHHKQIKPLPFVYPHVEDLPDPRSLFQPQKALSAPGKQVRTKAVDRIEDDRFADMGFFSYHYWMFIRFIFEGTEKNILLTRLPVSHWFGRLAWTIVQGLGIGVLFGFPLWCLAIVILGPIYRSNNLGALWAPQVIKLVYGAILGWMTNPVIATLALGSQAEHHLVVVEHDSEVSLEGVPASAIAGSNDPQRDRVETIHENEVLDSPRAPYSAGMTVLRRAPSSPSNSVHLTVPRAGTPASRARASSSASSSSRSSMRPPLTADVSYFRSLPPSTPRGTLPGLLPEENVLGVGAAGGISLAPPLSAPLAGTSRPRGATVSSEVPSERSFSYALGGTGGRAKRTRSQRSESVGAVPTIPSLNLPRSSAVGMNEADEMGMARKQQYESGERDVFGSLPSSAIRPSSSQQRTSSALGTGSLGASTRRPRSPGRDSGSAEH